MTDIARLGIEVDTSQIERADRKLDQLGGSAGVAARKTKRATDGMASGYSNASKAIALAKVALISFVAATASAVLAVRRFISGTSEAEAAQAQLAAAILSTGGAANRSRDQLNAFASELQSVTNFGDEAINAMQGVLLTFTQIEGATFDRATSAILDLSTAMGTDLKSSALQVGKALNDPILGMTALSRSGIQFTETQKEAVKAMVATNDIAGAQALILGELETQFGGSAAAARDTLGGALTSLGNAWGDLFELSGPATESLKKSVEGLVSAVSDPRFVAGIQTIGNGLFRILGFLVNVVSGFSNMIGAVAEGSRLLFGYGETSVQVANALSSITLSSANAIEASAQLDNAMRTSTNISKERAGATLNEMRALQAKLAIDVVAAQQAIREGEAYQEVTAAIERSKIALTGLYELAERGNNSETSIKIMADQASRMEIALSEAVTEQSRMLSETGAVGDAFSANANLIRDLVAALSDAGGEAFILKDNTTEAAITADELRAKASQIAFVNANASATALVAKLGVSLRMAQLLDRIGGSGGASGPDQAVSQVRSAYNLNNLIDQGLATVQTFKAVNDTLAGGSGTSRAIEGVNEATEDFDSTMKGAVKTMDEMGVSKAEILIGGINSVSDAFGNWISNGLGDFKGFATSIIDTFKGMLAQMIAMALKNRILLSLGFGGSALPAAAGAATSGATGAASGALGTIGSGLMSGASGVVSGLFSGGLSGGATALTTALSGATTGLSGMATAIGAIALPVAAAVAAFSFFRTKTKKLDSGLRLTAQGMDLAIASFEKVKKTRFFGLSSRTSTNYSQAGGSLADPITQAFGAMTDAVAKSAAVLGISSEAFRGFSAELNLSLEGLSDEQAQAAVIQGLTDMGNQFAGMAGNLGNLAREGEDAMTTLARLGNELQTVNGVMATLGLQVYDVSIAGAAAASGLADMYGGIEQLAVATNAYYAAFYTTEEQLAHTTQGLTEAFAALGVAMPETRAGLRELIEGTAQDIAGARAVLEKPMPTFSTFSFLGNTRDFFKAIAARSEASSVISAASELQAGLISLSGTFDQMLTSSETLALAAENTAPAINDNTAAMEDAARAAEELAAGLAEAISKERLGIQRKIWRLMGDESSLRADDLSQLDASNRALQKRLWGLQDEAEATEAAARAIEDLVQSLSPESFGQALDYNLALGRASQGIAGVTATGVPLSVVPNSNAANDSLVDEIKNLKAELVNFKDESRGLNMNANADIRKIRLNSDRDQAIGTPAVRTS